MTVRIFAFYALAVALWAGTAQAEPPSDGRDAAAALTAVKDVCMPLLIGQSIADVAKTAGLKNSRDGWTLPVDGKRRIQIDPPHGSNPHVCSATLVHDPAASDAIVDALGGWAAGHTPVLPPVKVKQNVTGALYQLTTSSWYARTDKADISLVYNEQKSLDGQPVQGTLDQAAIIVELTPLAS